MPLRAVSAEIINVKCNNKTCNIKNSRWFDVFEVIGKE